MALIWYKCINRKHVTCKSFCSMIPETWQFCYMHACMPFDYNENDAMELRILANPTVSILISQQHITAIQSRPTTAICDNRFSCQIITCSGCQLPRTALWFCFIINLFNKHVQMPNAKKWRMLLYNQYSLEINQLISSRLFTISHHLSLENVQWKKEQWLGCVVKSPYSTA